MSKTRIGDVLESANTVDILFYIHNHPGCRKSDIYQNVTRNAHTKEKIECLGEEGLIDMEQTSRPNAILLSLSEKGQALTNLLLEAERILTQTHESE